MKKNVKIVISLIVVLIISIVLLNPCEKKKDLKNNLNGYLSIMIENEEGTYTKSDKFPTEDYVLNEEETHCENDGIISYKNGKVIFTGDKSDRCYIFFDVAKKDASEENIAKLLADANKDGQTQTLLYHDGTDSNDAGDFSYRYSGTSAKVNNYICFGGECANTPTDEEKYSNLYRIIGLFPTDESHNTYQLKIIKADYATETELGGSNVGARSTSNYTKSDGSYKGQLTTIPRYYWNNETNNNDWSKSNLQEKNLNGYYLNEYLGKKTESEKWLDMIENHIWITEGNTYDNIAKQYAKTAYTNEITNPSKGNYEAATTYQAKVGLMYASDYGYAAYKEAWNTKTLYDYDDSTTKANNWLYMGLYEWLITRQADYSGYAFYVYRTGYVNDDNVYSYDRAVRPVLFLNSSVKITSGDGTSGSPYKLSM